MEKTSEHFRNVIEPKLKECKTAGEMLHVLQTHYNLNDPLPMITSLAFRQGLKQAVVMIKPDPIYVPD